MNYFNYFTEIEDAFIRRRGKHLLVGTLDWALIESWKQMGVPLYVVLRGIEKAFDSYESRPRKRSVKSLLYCQEEVEAQYAEWLESQVGASAGDDGAQDADATAEADATTEADAANGGDGLPFPREAIAAHLSECRASVERARLAAQEAELVEALLRAAARLAELEKDFAQAARPNAEQLESALADLEGLLDRALRAGLSAEELSERRARAEEQLRPYRGRMERATYEQTLDNILAKSLREERRVPRLSLFYL